MRDTWKRLVWSLLSLAALGLGLLFLTACSGEAEPTQEVLPAATRAASAPTSPATSVSAAKQTWLVMLYSDADDAVLERDLFVDLNEAERVGSSDRVRMVAQMDRYAGAFSGDGDWTTAKRFFLTKDPDLFTIRSKVLQDLGEVNMADPQTLIDFATWAIKAYPSDKYVLILSDHGAGWPGGWNDPAPSKRSKYTFPLAQGLGNMMYLMDLDTALGRIRAQTGVDKLELIGLDACLMSSVEVLTALAPHARYAVASQEVEPALGWAYTGFLTQLVAHPEMDGAGLGKAIVNAYITDDARISDTQARQEYFQERYGLMSFLYSQTAEEMAQEMGSGVTLAAVDLSRMAEVNSYLDSLLAALAKTNQQVVAQTRTYAKSFTSIFGTQMPSPYIDLGNWVRLIQRNVSDSAVQQAANSCIGAMTRAVIAERHGEEKNGASGMSIYFPNSSLYQIPAAGLQSYTLVARRFAEESAWDDFLAYHYTGTPFVVKPGQVTAPAETVPVTAPGAGQISIAPIRLSATTIRTNQPVIIETNISGTGIGYVYLLVGYFDPGANALLIADMDYIEGSDTRELDGVYYPYYGSGTTIPIQVEWEPTIYVVSDGQNSAFALVSPESYGSTLAEAFYTVAGIYTFADSGERRYATLYFQADQLKAVYAFNEQDTTGAPHEITPQVGDVFTVVNKWLELDSSGHPAASFSLQEGATLTFGQTTWTWEEATPPAGDYLMGVLVQDLDGNTTERYASLTVTE